MKKSKFVEEIEAAYMKSYEETKEQELEKAGSLATYLKECGIVEDIRCVLEARAEERGKASAGRFENPCVIEVAYTFEDADRFFGKHWVKRIDGYPGSMPWRAVLLIASELGLEWRSPYLGSRAVWAPQVEEEEKDD